MVAVAVDPDGSLIGTLGQDLEREFFLRSAPKPLQATVSQRNGAGLEGERLAVASASHTAFPIHLAYVTEMLLEIGLDAGHLRCPPSRPSSEDADRLWAWRGRIAPERIMHNCSGKHAAMLRACVAQGWSLEYTEPTHPLQRQIVATASEAAGRTVEPVGVDGCGVPTLRSDATGLARIFSRLVNDDEYAEVATAFARFTSLAGGGERQETVLARRVPAVVKGGAAGCIGLGMLESGLAFAAKSWTGQSAPAVIALVELMDRLGVLADYPKSQLVSLISPRVLGGGLPVGSMQLLDG